MGIYLNPGNEVFARYAQRGTFVDKSELIQFTNKAVDNIIDDRILVSRPRRFGKTLVLSMLQAYYSKGCDSKDLFSGLAIAKDSSFERHLNQHNVITLDIQGVYSDAKKEKRLDEFPAYLSELVNAELVEVYPDEVRGHEKNLAVSLTSIHKTHPDATFVFLLDEWDVIYREENNNTNLISDYTELLKDLFKRLSTSASIDLVYMTGILPIPKQQTHSGLNNFVEFTMVDPGELAEYIGFTQSEVDALCAKYQMSVQEIKDWYEGYQLGSIGAIYCPASVVKALERRTIKNYWNKTAAPTELLELMNSSDADFQKAFKDLRTCSRKKGCILRRPVVEYGRRRSAMMVRKYANDPATLLEDLGNITQGPDDPKFCQRVELVSMVLSGEMSTTQVAKCAGISLRSIQGWVKVVDDAGWDALRPSPAIGRPNRLTADNLAEIRQVVQEDPTTKGYRRWSGNTLADYIRKTYHIKYVTSSAVKLINRLGLRSMLYANGKTVSGNPPPGGATTGNPPQNGATTGNPPQNGATAGNPPQNGATAGNPPQNSATTGNPPPSGATAGNSPQNGATTANPPQNGATTGNPPQSFLLSEDAPHVCPASPFFTRKHYTSDVTREQYALIRGILERNTRKTASHKYDFYEIFCGILYILRTGAQWRNLPGDFPPWPIVYYYFCFWCQTDENGGSCFSESLTALIIRFRNAHLKNDKPTLAIIDAKSIKNTDTATIKGFDAGKKVSGIKLHIAVDTLGLPVALFVTPANETDRNGALRMIVLNRKAFSEVKKILVDGGYSGEKFANEVQKILPDAEVEVVKRNELHTFKVLPKRWIVERSFAWLEKHRRLWKNCERKLNTTLQMTILAFLVVLLKRF